MHHIGQQLRFLADTLYRADGITAQQAMLLSTVDLLGAPTLGEAAATMATSHQNVKQLVTSLEGKGFLTIAQDAADARVRRLKTTAKSRRYWAARDGADIDVVVTWFDRLSAREIGDLSRLLAKLHPGIVQAAKRQRSP
ncbi:MAG: winged helix-turn-helix transcriptional regulator [Labilithrix sp.]|nr:winged helix-turn-helix transcriptional regulator [Labilithrix sp.]MCW5813761.1 winged helix-turn-helix transcriptional regulator [Labilithrix sp.]